MNRFIEFTYEGIPFRLFLGDDPCLACIDYIPNNKINAISDLMKDLESNMRQIRYRLRWEHPVWGSYMDFEPNKDKFKQIV